jgi:hypothetical protein
VAGHKAGLGNLALKNSQGRNRHCKYRWLGDLGEAQLFFRPVEANLRQFVAESLVGFFERLPRDGELFEELFSHAHSLRTLARENECKPLGCYVVQVSGFGHRLDLAGNY